MIRTVLRGISFLEVEETPEPLATADAAVRRSAQSLVVALGVVVLEELSDDAAQMIFAERDDVPQALLLDRANEPFRVGVQIRAARRQPQERHPPRWLLWGSARHSLRHLAPTRATATTLGRGWVTA